MPLIFLSAHGDVPAAVNAMQHGAIDFLQKPFNSQAFLHSINRLVKLAAAHYERRQQFQDVQQLLARLSSRELNVLDGLLAGQTSKQIARDLGISPKTVDVHRASVMRKLLVNNGTELVRLLGTSRSST